MLKIKKIVGRQIIDSRGNPTCEADIILDDGTLGRGAVPSGASTGTLEAIEIRDNDPNIYFGKSFPAAQAGMYFSKNSKKTFTLGGIILELGYNAYNPTFSASNSGNTCTTAPSSTHRIFC